MSTKKYIKTPQHELSNQNQIISLLSNKLSQHYYNTITKLYKTTTKLLQTTSKLLQNYYNESSGVLDKFCSRLLNKKELECVLPELKNSLATVEQTKKSATEEIIDIFETKPLSTACTTGKVLSINNDLPNDLLKTVSHLANICEIVEHVPNSAVNVVNGVNPKANVDPNAQVHPNAGVDPKAKVDPKTGVDPNARVST
ncbi:21760_t:CDS:2 [Cetraspora pellucida]|uniref:21760_t:CDS:1 n=1 Tax=Cetraspora pellucida TaxID=1433469 RepID=A0A9N9JMJ1_9GLOM|nr:21760_t:CDS:2 [Cetraspora pellucida]